MIKWSQFYFMLMFTCTIAAFANTASAQGTFVLEKVMYGQSGREDNTPISWDVENNGYVASFSSVYRSNCVGSYKALFTFDRDIRRVPANGEVRIRIQKLTGKTPCGYKKSGAAVVGSNNLFPKVSPEFPSVYKMNGNIASTQNRIAMWDGGRHQSTGVVKFEIKRNLPYSAFALAVSGANKSNHLIFLYRYEAGGQNNTSVGAEIGINRPGSDYRTFFQSQNDPKICQAACINEGRCRAWTWVRAGLQGAQSKCWLKHSIPQATRSDCCVSGTKFVK